MHPTLEKIVDQLTHDRVTDILDTTVPKIAANVGVAYAIEALAPVLTSLYQTPFLETTNNIALVAANLYLDWLYFADPQHDPSKPPQRLKQGMLKKMKTLWKRKSDSWKLPKIAGIALAPAALAIPSWIYAPYTTATTERGISYGLALGTLALANTFLFGKEAAPTRETIAKILPKKAKLLTHLALAGASLGLCFTNNVQNFGRDAYNTLVASYQALPNKDNALSAYLMQDGLARPVQEGILQKRFGAHLEDKDQTVFKPYVEMTTSLGTPINAVATGSVSVDGKKLTLTEGNGTVHLYDPVDNPKTGLVQKGEQIGTSGKTLTFGNYTKKGSGYNPL